MTHAAAPHLTIVLDCGDGDRLARFWADALGYVVRERYEQYMILTPPDGVIGPVLLLQEVPEPKRGKNRMHFDINVADVETEAGRLEGNGATRLGTGAIGNHGWITLADPEGNEFCVCGPVPGP